MNKQIRIVAILLSVISGSFACNQRAYQKQAKCLDSVEKLKRDLLGINIQLAWETETCYDIDIKEMQDEYDNSLKWQGIEFRKDRDVIFFAETSWMNNEIVERITIYDSSIKYSGNIFVGQTMQNFRRELNHAYLDESFGTFYVQLFREDNVSIELETKPQDNLINWESDISQIPDDIKVKSIIINKLD